MKFAKVCFIFLSLLLFAGCRGNQATDATGTNPGSLDFVQGVLTYPVELKGVFAQLEAPQVFSAEADGHTGFAYVLLTVSMANRSSDAIIPSTITIVDRQGNQYISRQDNTASVTSQLTRMPLAINEGENARGHLLYLVPSSALQSELRMRWESVDHNSRIDILLGPLTVQ